MKKGGLLSIELSPPPRGKESGETEMMADEGEGEAGDMEAAKLDAARGVAMALGIDPKKVDAQALSDALEEHKAACEAVYGEEG